MTYVVTRTKSFQASAAIARALCVRLNGSGKLAVCGATDPDCIGFTNSAALAADVWIAVVLINCEGTVEVTAGGVITRGATVYQAAGGKVAATGSIIVGEANEAASASGSIIEVVPGVGVGGVSSRILGIPLTEGRGADLAVLGPTSSAGDLHLELGTNAVYLEGEPAEGETEVSVAIFEVVLPPDYAAAQTVTISVNAQVEDTATANIGACTVDLNVYEMNAITASAELCSTAAQTIALGSWAVKTFTITSAALVAGDRLFVKLTTSVVEQDGTGDIATAQVEKLQLNYTAVR